MKSKSLKTGILMIGLFFRFLQFILCRRVSRTSASRILVLRVDERMGNLLLTTPLLAALRSAFPNAELDALVASRYCDLISDNEYNVSVIAFEKRHLFRSPLAWLRTVIELRRRNYDIVIDASHEHAFSLTSALICLWTGSPLRAGHERGHSESVYTHVISVSADDLPEAKRKLRLVEALTRQEHECITWLGKNRKEAEQWAGEWLAENNSHKLCLLIVFTGARKADRRLSAADFMFLSELRDKSDKWKLLFVGGLEEKPLLEELRMIFSDIALFAPDVDLFRLRALLFRCDAVLCADTGPLHLAWALGKPLLSLHRAGDIARWGHADTLSQAIPFESGSELSRKAAADALMLLMCKIACINENT